MHGAEAIILQLILSLVGGVLIGGAGLVMLFGSGKVLGVSGIALGLIGHEKGDAAWRWAFLGGLLAGGLLSGLFTARGPAYDFWLPPIVITIAGVLVGYGARLGSGCTSGHGVCGIGRLSPRSLAATVVFILVGMATVQLVRTLVGY